MFLNKNAKCLAGLIFWPNEPVIGTEWSIKIELHSHLKTLVLNNELRLPVNQITAQLVQHEDRGVDNYI